MSNELEQDPDTLHSTSLQMNLSRAKAKKIDSLTVHSDISLRQLAAKITTQLKAHSAELIALSPFKTAHCRNANAQSELIAMGEQLTKAQKELTALQLSDGDTGNHLHLRVLKELAAQQQQQLMQHRNWQDQIASLLEQSGENLPSGKSDLQLLVSKLQMRLDLTNSQRDLGEKLKGQLQDLKNQLELARAANQRADETLKAREIDFQRAVEQQECIHRQRETAIAGRDEEVLQLQEQNLSQLQSDLELVKHEHQKTLSDAQLLRAEVSRWQERFDEDLKNCLEMEVQRRLSEMGTSDLAKRQGDLAPSDDQLNQDNRALREQLLKGKAHLEQNEQKVKDLKRQLQLVEQEKVASLHRAGLMQSRLEDHFKANQQLKKQLLGSQQQADGDQTALKNLHSELERLRNEERAWTFQRLELQKELVNQAQERAEAKQEVGRLAVKEQDQQLMVGQLRKKESDDHELIERLNQQLSDEREKLLLLQDHSQRELAHHRLQSEQAKSAHAAENKEQLQQQQMQLQAMERQNNELRQQLDGALALIDEQRAKQSDLMQGAQQTQKMVHQLVEQLREKDVRAQFMHRQLHKRGKDTLCIQEQLEKSEKEIKRLRELVANQKKSEESAQILAMHVQSQAKEIQVMTQSLRKAEARASQLETFERSYTQLQQLLTPLRNALPPIDKPDSDDQPVCQSSHEPSDLFQEQLGSTKIKAHLFDQLT